VQKNKNEKIDEKAKIEEAAYRMITALGAPPMLALGPGVPMADVAFAGKAPRNAPGVTTKNGVTVGANGKPIREAKVVDPGKPKPATQKPAGQRPAGQRPAGPAQRPVKPQPGSQQAKPQAQKPNPAQPKPQGQKPQGPAKK
jgi:hypothetical protein